MIKIFAFLIAAAAVCGLRADEANLAANAPATASSLEAPAHAASNVTDGNSKTRWSSARTDNEWITVDLGDVKKVGQIQLDWETAAGKEYAVQFSTDGENFTDVFTVTDGKAGTRIIRIKPQETRYIRIQGKKRTTQHGYSLWAIKAFAASDNLALFAKATASSVERKDCPVEAAVDGNPKTRWSSGRKDDEKITIDLGDSVTVGKIILKWEQAAGAEYLIQFSDDGENFTEVFHKTDGKSGATETITIDPQRTRFIRIQGIKRTTTYGYSLWEIEAYEK